MPARSNGLLGCTCRHDLFTSLAHTKDEHAGKEPERVGGYAKYARADENKIRPSAVRWLSKCAPPKDNADREGEQRHEQPEAKTKDNSHRESDIDLLRTPRPIGNRYRYESKPQQRVAAPGRQENSTCGCHQCAPCIRRPNGSALSGRHDNLCTRRHG